MNLNLHFFNKKYLIIRIAFLGILFSTYAAHSQTVSSINSSTSDASPIGIGGSVSIQVSFSAGVDVAGVIELELETGSTDRKAIYFGGSQTNVTSINFTYNVQAGDVSSDLNNHGSDALTLQAGASIKATGTSTDISLTTPTSGTNLASNKDLEIDGVAPAAPPAPNMTSGSDTGSANNDELTNDDTPTFSGSYGENITLELLDGTTQVGSDATGSSYNITSSTLSEGSHNMRLRAVDDAGNETLGAIEPIIIDKTGPTVVLDDDHGDAIVRNADNVIITATFTEINGLDGTPTIKIGSQSTQSMSAGGNALEWTYNWNVPSGNNGPAAVVISVDDDAGNPVSSTTAGTGQTLYTIDNNPPTVSVGAPSPSITMAGPVSFPVTYSGANSVNLTNADVNLVLGGSANATTINVTGGTTSTPTVTLTGITGSSGTLSISIDAGTATDVAGNANAQSPNSPTVTVDNNPPTATVTVQQSDIGGSNLTQTVVINYNQDMNTATTPTINLSGPNWSPSNAGAWSNADRRFTRSFVHDGDPETNSSATASVTAASGATDLAGNEATADSSPSFNIDTQAPNISSAVVAPNSGQVIEGQSITVIITEGSSETGLNEGSTTATINGVDVSGNFTDQNDGTYEFTYLLQDNQSEWSSGNLSIDLGLEDDLGNESRITTLTANTLAGDPDIPKIPTGIALNNGDDTGFSDADAITSIGSGLTIQGPASSAESGTTIQLYDNSTLIAGATGIVAGNGSWNIDISRPEGNYSIRAKSTDAAGNESNYSSTLVLVIDQTDPNKPGPPDLTASSDTESPFGSIGTDSDNITKTVLPTFQDTGTDPENNSFVKIYSDAQGGVLGSGFSNGGGDFSITLSTSLNEGDHGISITATDAAGNEGPASDALDIKIDITPPQALIGKIQFYDHTESDHEHIDIEFDELIDLSNDQDLNVGFSTSDGAYSTSGSEFQTTYTTPPSNGSVAKTNLAHLRSSSNNAWDKDTRVSYDAATGQIYDIAGNAWPDQTNLITTDPAPPIIISGLKFKPDGGPANKEQIIFRLSEELILTEGATVTGFSVDGVPVVDAKYSDKTFSNTITLTSPAATGWTQNSLISYVGGNVEDPSANAMATITNEAILMKDVSISSNNASPNTWAKVNDEIYVDFTSTSALSKAPVVTIDGLTAVDNGSVGQVYKYKVQATSAIANGIIDFSIESIEADDGDSTYLTFTTDLSEITFDKTNPVVTPVTIASDYLAHPDRAAPGSKATVTFSTSDNASTPIVSGSNISIAGQPVTLSGSDPSYSAQTTAGLPGTLTEVILPISIQVFDAAGNSTTATAITAGNNVLFDKTNPTVVSIVPDPASSFTTIGSTNGILGSNTVAFIVKFSEAVDGVQASDFTIAPDPSSISGANVAASGLTLVAGVDGDTDYTIRVNGITGTGQIQLDYNTDASSIFDLAGQVTNNAPVAGDLFSIVNTEPSAHVSSPSTSNLTQSSFTLDWLEGAPINPATGYMILIKGPAGIFPTVIDGDNALIDADDNDLTGDNLARINVPAGTSTIDLINGTNVTGLLAGALYDVQIHSFNLAPGVTSDNVDFNNSTPAITSADLPVASETTVTNGTGALSISSIATTNTDWTPVFSFDINDDKNFTTNNLAPYDDAATKFSTLTINQLNAPTGTNSILQWDQVIDGARLTDNDGNMQDVNVAINATSIVFSSIDSDATGDLGWVDDNLSKTYTLEIYLKADMSGSENYPDIIDQLNFHFEVNSGSFVFDNSPNKSSTFDGMQSQHSGDDNVIVEVLATEFELAQASAVEGINVPLNAYPDILVKDENGNLDLNYQSDGGVFTLERLDGTSPFGFSTDGTFAFEGNGQLNASSLMFTTTGDGRFKISGTNGGGMPMLAAENSSNTVEVINTNFAPYDISEFNPRNSTQLESSIDDMTLLGFEVSAGSNGTNPNFTNVRIDFKDEFDNPKSIDDIFTDVRLFVVSDPLVQNALIYLDYIEVTGATINAGASTSNSLLIDGFNESIDINTPGYYVIVANVDPAANFTSGLIKASMTPSLTYLPPNSGSFTGSTHESPLFDFIDTNSPQIISFSPANNSTTTPFNITAFDFTFDEPVSYVAPIDPDIQLKEFVGDGDVPFDRVTVTTDPDGRSFSISFWDDTTTPLTPFIITLDQSTQYYILIGENLFVDTSNNFNQAFPDKGIWNFTTTDTAPPSFVFNVDNTELIENIYDIGIDVKVRFDEVGIAYALALDDGDPDPLDFDAIKNDPNTVVIDISQADKDFAASIRGLSVGGYNLFVTGEDFGGNIMVGAYNTALNVAQKVPFSAAPFTDLVSNPELEICVGDYQPITEFITIIEGDNDDFSTGSLELLLPANYVFDTSVGSAIEVLSGGDITITSFSYRNNSTIAIDITSSGSSNRDEIRVSGLKIKALPEALDGDIIVVENVAGGGTNDIPFGDVAASLIINPFPVPEALFTLDPAGVTVNKKTSPPIALIQDNPIDPFLGQSYVFSGNGVNNDFLYPDLAPLGENTITLTQKDEFGCYMIGSQVVDVINTGIVGLEFTYCDNVSLVQPKQSLINGEPDNPFAGTYDLEEVDASVAQILENPGDVASWDPIGFVFTPGIAIPDTSTAEFVAIDFTGLYRNRFDANDTIVINQTVLIYPAPEITLSTGALLEDINGVIEVCEDFGDINFVGKPVPNTAGVSGIFNLLTSDAVDANAAVINTGEGTATINITDLVALEGTGTYNFTYTYDNSGSTCAGSATLTIIVHPKPIANFTLAGRTNYDGCVGESVQFVNGSNITLNSTYLWDFDDPDNSSGANANQSVVQESEHIFSVAGSYRVSLTTTTDKGCISETVEEELSIGNNPVTSFDFKNVVTDQPTLFTNTTPSNAETNITELEWQMDGVITGQINAGFNDPYAFSFASSGVHEVVLTATTDKLCAVADTLDFFTVPQFDLDESVLYAEDFDADNGDIDTGQWIPWGENVSWGLGTSGGDVIKTADNNNFWVTGVDQPHNGGEISFVYSPVFNITELERPMVQLLTNFNLSNSNGVIIEYLVDSLAGNSKDGVLGDWQLLGAKDTGDEWYNGEGLTDVGGNQQVGQFGWTDTRAWANSKHTLGRAKSLSPDPTNARIQFRVNFKANEVNQGDFDGFGFDDFFLGNRTRTVLLENFTSMGGDADVKTQNDAIAELRGDDDLAELALIEYHTSFDGTDFLNQSNQTDPLSRALYYGITANPRVAIDGVTDSLNRTYTNWGERFYAIRTLNIAPFDIIPTISNVNNGQIGISASIKALRDLSGDYRVHIAVVQDSIPSIDVPTNDIKTGETLFSSVLRKMLPDAGGTKFDGGIGKDEQVSVSVEWNPTNLIDTDIIKLKVIIFIQNEKTKEVYQATSDPVDFNTITGVMANELSGNINLYPNPADDRLTLDINANVSDHIEVMLYNSKGQLMDAYQLNPGRSSMEFATSNYEPGVYLLRFEHPTGGLIQKKFIIQHR